MGRNKYSEFKRNQMRWALAVYKWKVGCSWNQFNLYMADELEVRDFKKFEKIISNKDAKRFVVEGVRTGEEKLEVFEKFIKKVLPESLTMENDEDLILNVCNNLARFSSLNNLMKNENDEATYMDTEGYVDNNVFVSYSTDNLSRLKLDFSGSEDGFLNPPVRLINAVEFCVLQRISKSKFFFVKVFKIEIPDELFLVPIHYLTFKNKIITKGSSDFYKYSDAFLEKLSSSLNPNNVKIYDYRKGVAIPVQGGISFYCLLKSQSNFPSVGGIDTFDVIFKSYEDKIREVLIKEDMTEEDIYLESKRTGLSPLLYEEGQEHIDIRLQRLEPVVGFSDGDEKYYATGNAGFIKSISLKMRLSLI